MKELNKISEWPPSIPEDIVYVEDVLRRNELCGINSYYTRRAESAWSKYLGVKRSILTNSGTAALHMSLSVLDTTPGDEVIIPSFTFIATALAVLQRGLIPVFCDVKKNKLYMDEEKIEDLITERTKAIIPVHINGCPANMDSIMMIARRYNLIVIEDACQAHGAEFDNKKVGTIGHMGAFSLNKSKNLPAAEGGFFVTNDRKFYEKARMVHNFGEIPREDEEMSYNSYSMGWMHRTTEFTAALAYAHIPFLDDWNKKRVENTKILNQGIENIEGLTIFQPESRKYIPTWRYAFLLEEFLLKKNNEFKKIFIKHLKSHGLKISQWQNLPIQKQPLIVNKNAFGGGFPWVNNSLRANFLDKKYLENTEDIINRIVWLDQGVQPPNEEDQMFFILEVIKKSFNEAKRELNIS